MPRKPQVYIVGGPNGSGKTTFARVYLPKFAKCDEFVNADLIARGLSPFAERPAEMRAGRLVLQSIRTLSAQGKTFGFETTLSGRSYAKIFRELRAKGYGLHCIFLWLKSPELSLKRIAERVKQGGHDVPEFIVRRRFSRGISNLFSVYRSLLDSFTILENSSEQPQLVARGNGEKIDVSDETTLRQMKVVGGIHGI